METKKFENNDNNKTAIIMEMNLCFSEIKPANFVSLNQSSLELN